MTFRVNIRFGHLDRMPRCEHGRIEGYCDCGPTPDTRRMATTTKIGVVRSTGSGLPEGSSK
jgi:hypothetical protein